MLVLALSASTLPAKDRDPEYDAILAAYKAKKWTELDRLAPAFLKEKPDYEFAHSIRFMVGDSYRKRGRLPEAAAAFREYLRFHPAATLAQSAHGALVRVLSDDARHAAALAEADRYLEAFPDGKTAPLVGFLRARALEETRRFNEAAEAYRAITGRYAELAAYQVGVALFRGRKFADARKALESFLRFHPNSKKCGSARDYLFRTETGFEDIRNGIVHDYTGKYEEDERFAHIRKSLAAKREAALKRIEAVLGRSVPRTFLIRFEDAGANRSGHFARTRIEVVKGKPRHVVVLYTEYAVMDAFDLDRTLTHELYHCVQRDRLGENHFRAPKWVREGAALYVAGQGPVRTHFLAAEVGRRTSVDYPMRLLVNGLSGRHAFEDYAEDVAAFESVEKRHGRRKAVALLLRLLETVDVGAAIRDVLDEDFATFEAAASKHARRVLEPLVGTSRTEVVRALKCCGKKDWTGALEALPKNPGVYDAVIAYIRGRALHETGKHGEALRVVREDFLAKHRRFATFVDNARLLEVEILAALKSEQYAVFLERAVLDLEPTGCYGSLRRFLAKQKNLGDKSKEPGREPGG
jgi:outer membrane protein assembly factor BamD (BamD/ComL family)